MNEKIKLLKDENGNFWCYIGYDETEDWHEVTVVDEDNGYYTNTNITSYLTNEEYANCTQIEVEV